MSLLITGENVLANIIIIGAQWGDEGKAKITDLLSEKSDIIIRYQGGCNAGHTVVVNGETYKFHLIPSGILYKDKICMIGPGTVINPLVLSQEIEGLKKRNISVEKLYISNSAHITLPYHIDFDSCSEKTLGEKKIGTTGKGIGPTYTDKFNRTGIRVEDLFDEEALKDKLSYILPQKNLLLERIYGLKPYSVDEILECCKKYAEIIAPHRANTTEMLAKALNEGHNILFEGAQGTMLDIDHGTYPYVTSSNPISGGACTGTGVGPSCIDRIVGISKAYITRVGEGPFITELGDEYGTKIQAVGHEFGTTTGRARRCGWFDAVVGRYSAIVNGLTDLALTKLDVLNDFDEIKICTAYKDKRNGEIYNYYPTNIYLHKHLEPVYEVFEGWKQDISGIKSYSELPEAAKKYLERIQDLTGVKISIISIGAGREETIMLKDFSYRDKKEFVTQA